MNSSPSPLDVAGYRSGVSSLLLKGTKKGESLMACKICGRQACTESFHSIEEQEEFETKTEGKRMKLIKFRACSLKGIPYKTNPYTEIVLSPNGRIWLLSNIPGTAAIAREDITEKVKLEFYDLPDKEKE